ncbi:cation diffusion facilitator family transporter [uncultured Pseudokineococcus sp.]|uniref:cation diffusion facilitator family transporter n=1 Tax=uncultured Pseudokineococcus sp. TaxID=1642928 RepID=UPI002615CEA9|nr:cation diffusion facilitator family transporter [uncultured Pseudokineococcus sp.]
MGAGHTHDHGGDAGTDQRRRLLTVLVLTATVMVVEVVGGILSGSLALLADAAHMLTDVVGLGIAVLAATLALRPPTARRTWGYRRAEVLGASLQAGLLLAVGVLIAVEGVRRLLDPPEVTAGLVLVFGAIGLAVNIAGLVILARGRAASVNTRAAFLEVAADGIGSVAVLVSAAVVLATGWQRADALASFVVVALIVPRTLSILRETTAVLLEVAPRDLDLDAVRTHLLEQAHVHAVHDLHASEIVSGLPVLSAHVVIDDTCFLDGHAPRVLDALQTCVAEHFPVPVHHATFQLEPVSHHEHERHAHA